MDRTKRCFVYLVTLLITILSWIGLETIIDGIVLPQRSDIILMFILAYFMSDWVYFRYIYKH